VSILIFSEAEIEKNKKIFQKKKPGPPGPDGPNASSWYGRLTWRFCRYHCDCSTRTTITAALGVPQTLEGTGTGNNLFHEWSVVGTWNGNREQVCHCTVWSPRKTTGGQKFAAAIFF